jgi:hypothetical protein
MLSHHRRRLDRSDGIGPGRIGPGRGTDRSFVGGGSVRRSRPARIRRPSRSGDGAPSYSRPGLFRCRRRLRPPTRPPGRIGALSGFVNQIAGTETGMPFDFTVSARSHPAAAVARSGRAAGRLGGGSGWGRASAARPGLLSPEGLRRHPTLCRPSPIALPDRLRSRPGTPKQGGNPKEICSLTRASRPRSLRNLADRRARKRGSEHHCG